MVPPPTDSKTILVLGGSFCGIAVSHQLLRSLPESYTLTLLTPSTHLYYNIAAVRAVGKDSAPGLGAGNEKLHYPILDGFKKYGEKFTFIQGRAKRVDLGENNLTYTPLSDDTDKEGEGEESTIHYEHLIVATGSRAHDNWPFKSASPLPALKARLLECQSAVQAARKIVLSGGGPTSVETAGEIATFYPDKKITIVASSQRLLPTAPEKVSATAEATLGELGVEVRKGARVTGFHDGEVRLEDGGRIEADLCIPTAGLVPNSEFLPKELRAENGWVKVNENLRTQKENVWALGDVTNLADKRLVIVAAMVPVVSANVLATIKKSGEALKKYDEKKLMDVLLVPIGGKFAKGTGHFNGYKIPGVLVWAGKGRSMIPSNPQDFADGKMMPGFVKV